MLSPYFFPPSTVLTFRWPLALVLNWKHAVDTNRFTAFVNAFVLDFLNIWQWVHCTTEVGFPCFGVRFCDSWLKFACKHSQCYEGLAKNAICFFFKNKDLFNIRNGPSPVWIAHCLNRQASLSISHPWRAACFQGMENIFFS